MRVRAASAAAVVVLDVLCSLLVPSGAQAATVAEGTWENTSSAFHYKGSWKKARSTSDSGGSSSVLKRKGYAQLTFRPTGLSLVAPKDKSSGKADVYLDGVKKARVDLYSSATKFRQNVFELKGLSETGHTLKVVRTGDKSSASGGRGISLDAFVAPDVYAPAAPAAVTATASRTGADLTWAKSPELDVTGYRVLRRADGSSTDVLVGTTDAKSTSFADVGLANASAYSWRVVARDTTGNDSSASAPAELRTAADPFVSHPRRYATCPAATTTVSTRAQLLSAIASATSGTVIVLRPGSYGSDYVIKTRASASAPLWICGPRSAVLSREVGKGYGVRFDGASNVVLAGMTVREVQKGVSAQRSDHLTIADLRVERIGEEAIHLKNQTTDSTVIGNAIDTTGLLTKNYGEGVYVGTAQGNWCVYNDCQPDASDRNVVALNTIRGTTAEAIEAKAGTNDGTMWRNTTDGAAISADDADSLIQVMGSGWVVAGNRGSHAPDDAIQVWNTDGGRYGLDNIVYANSVSDALRGYVARLPFVESGNVVGCDNVAAGKSLGMSNKTCQN